MNRLAKTFLMLFAVLVVLIVGTTLYGVHKLNEPHPTHAGTLQLEGLQDEVRVLRDQHGVAHIYAQNEHDLFMAQGYVHAQDRFWQMEFWRHIGQGRLSEIIGEQGVENDKFIRTAGWNRIAAETVAYYQEEVPEFYQILEWYSAGVNGYLAAQGENISVNHTILSAVNGEREIEPWTPLNTTTWGVVMAHDLGGNYTAELRRARLSQQMSVEELDDLWPPYPYNRRPVIAPTELQVQGGDGVVDGLAAVDYTAVNLDLIAQPPANGFALGTGDFAGSNNWVVNGEHTTSGLPLLANDPHLGIQMPSIWYEVGLYAPDYHVRGFSFAGTPGVVVGYNERIAWGVTNVGSDTQDLFIEKINPENPNQYEFEGEWREIETIDEVIKVADGEDVVLPVRFTHHGPILSDVVEAGTQVLAFQWTDSDPMTLLESVVLLNKAQNFDDFVAALRFWDTAGQNMVYADVDGNIGYQTTGVVPVRKSGNGEAPVPGWTGEYEWVGVVPYEAMPTLYNPPQGYIVTANNAVVDEAYPYFLDQDWTHGDRAMRIEMLLRERIDAGEKLTAEDMAAIQFDSYSLMAELYVPQLLALPSNGDESLAKAQALLKDWDYQARRDSGAALLFEMFLRELLTAVVADELTPQAEEDYLANGGTQFVFLANLATDAESAWWDDVETAEVVESRADVLAQALSRGVSWLEMHHNPDSENWAWGNLHTATFVSNPLGQSGIKPLEGLVNRGPFPADGGFGIVNANSWRWQEPAAVTGHVSMRYIADLSDLSQSFAVIPTGQSGHPGHEHYDDQMGLWANGFYHDMVAGDVAEETAVDELVLRP